MDSSVRKSINIKKPNLLKQSKKNKNLYIIRIRMSTLKYVFLKILFLGNKYFDCEVSFLLKQSCILRKQLL